MNKFILKITTFVITVIFLFNMSNKSNIHQSEFELKFIKTITNSNKKSNLNIRILTYNLLSDGIGYNGADVDTRKDGVSELLKGLEPDILALQEMNFSWFKAIKYNKNLKYINTQRSLSKNNMTALFYNKNRLTLSEYGERTYTRGSNPRLRKIVWALFKDNITGKNFCVVNTHLNLSDEENTTALTQCNELKDFALNLEITYKSPIIITGDFNSYKRGKENSETSAIYETLSLCFNNAVNHTSNKIQGKERNLKNTTDHIFSRGEVRIKTTNILSHRELSRLSDHFPLYADVKFY